MSAIKKEVVIGDCRLILGDCMEVMPLLGEFDAVVTDPPYLLESGGNTTGEMGGKFNRANYDNSGAIVTTEIDWVDFMPVISDRIKQGHAYFMCNNRHVASAQNAAENAGFRFHNLLVWHKSTITPNRWYMKNLEFTLFMFRGKAVPISDKGLSQLIRMETPRGVHPNQKPWQLMESYIRSSCPNSGSVLDPFMGSGSTLVACVKSRRKGTGIELDPEYFEIACERVRKAYEQPDIFIEAEKQPELVQGAML